MTPNDAIAASLGLLNLAALLLCLRQYVSRVVLVLPSRKRSAPLPDRRPARQCSRAETELRQRVAAWNRIAGAEVMQ